MKSIQFKPFLIERIIAGKKTETRRLVKNKTKPRYKVGETVYIKEKLYRNVDNGISFEDGEPIPDTNWGWKRNVLSPMFMPEKYARLFLRITDINIAWLQNLSEADAIAEGIFLTDYGWSWKASTQNDDCFVTPRIAFANLWDSINGDDQLQCWHADPEVFVYKFEVVEKP